MEFDVTFFTQHVAQAVECGIGDGLKTWTPDMEYRERRRLLVALTAGAFDPCMPAPCSAARHAFAALKEIERRMKEEEKCSQGS